MQRTLKRELKVLEIVKREAIDSSDYTRAIHTGLSTLPVLREPYLAAAPGIGMWRHSRGTLRGYVPASAGAVVESLGGGTRPLGVWVISPENCRCHPAEAPYG